MFRNCYAATMSKRNETVCRALFVCITAGIAIKCD